MSERLCTLCDEDCRTAVFGKTERTVGWEGNGELATTTLVRHCKGKPAATDRPNLPSLSHSFTLDWAVTCRSRREAEAALRCAEKLLATLGVQLNRRKTRIVHVRQGFAFLGYTIRRGRRALYLPDARIKSGARSGDLYAYPTQKSIDRFKDAIRRSTQRRVPLRTVGLIRELNPVIRGWGEYYKRAHVRRLFNQLDRWVVRRLWSHHYKRWRCQGWRTLPTRRLRSELGLVSLVALIPSLRPRPLVAPS